MRVLLVGQALSSQSSEPFGGLSGQRLATLAGLSQPAFLATFERVNLLNRYPGKRGRGDAFPREEARRAALALVPRFAGRRVVLVGLVVAKVFRVEAPLFAWAPAFGGDLAISPHPSGLSRWWNDPANVEVAARFWREAAAGSCP